jgi:hypothetical protein
MRGPNVNAICDLCDSGKGGYDAKTLKLDRFQVESHDDAATRRVQGPHTAIAG